ncbi:UNKNOWN [Stylonychia lemnae]|uniref:Uncharacterized protein n=1 Tax=Stylonychia lemnae TaxID=5949 RepID=A0A078B5W6_STYLE|nr:UNKNOWN [Stylonychia lemnae]|eukprot:CDW89900.1 UNKNOWN [Stylonychia lemnae]
MSGKRQPAAQQLNQQSHQGAHNRPNSFSKTQNFTQSYNIYQNSNNNQNINSEMIGVFGGATPDRKQNNNNLTGNQSHANDGSASSYIKGSRIGIVNNKHGQLIQSQTQQASLSARPHYNIQHNNASQQNHQLIGSQQINSMAGAGQQLPGKINIPSISPIRLGNPKQTISSNTRNHNLQQNQSSQQQPQRKNLNSQKVIQSSSNNNNNVAQHNNNPQAITTKIDLSRSIQETFNYIQQNQIPTQQNPQIVINQQIQQQDDSNLIYTKEKIKKLKDENKKLHQLLTDTEERFKSKLDQTRRESEGIMKIFNQILPILRQVMSSQQQQQTFNSQQIDLQEAQNILKFLESNSNNLDQRQQLPGNVSNQIDNENQVQMKIMQDRINNLELEVSELKDTNHKYLKYIQQQMVLSRIQEQELIKLRKENEELQAYKKSIDLYFSSNLQNSDKQDSTTTFNDQVSTQHNYTNMNSDPTPAFLKATLINGIDQAEIDDLGTGQSSNLDSNKIELPDFFKQQSTVSMTGQGLSLITDYSPIKTSNLQLANIGDNKLIEENIKQLMPNAMKKSRSSSSPFTMSNNFIKYNINNNDYK